MARFSTPPRVLRELANAPATIQEIAQELGISEHRAGVCLRKLHENGRVVRRNFVKEGERDCWLYLLIEHDREYKGE